MKIPPLRCALLTITTQLIAACTTEISIEDIEGEQALYFGLVRIETPKVNNSVIAYKHAGLGISVGQDIIIGWNEGKHVFVPATSIEVPGKLSEAPCQIVIFVESDEDAVFTNQLLAQFDEGIVCTANF